MLEYGLIGQTLGYSFSKVFFEKKFEKEGIDAKYSNFELAEIVDLNTVFEENPNLHGLNVTIPYKEEIIPFLDEVDPVAAAIGAVNTIKISEGRKFGFNTDVIGFGNSLKPFLTHGMEKASHTWHGRCFEGGSVRA